MTELEQFIDTLRQLVERDDAIKTNHVSIGLLRPAAQQLLTELDEQRDMAFRYASVSH